MELDVGAINYLAVFISALAICIFGSFWYSPKIFWNTWQQLKGLNPEDLPNVVNVMIGSIVMAVMKSFLVAILAQWINIDGWVEGLWLGFIVGLVVACTSATNSFYEGMKIKLYVITAGFHLISIMIAGSIIGRFS